MRVGLQLDAGCGSPVQPEVVAAVERAAAVFEQAGATVEPRAPFMTPELLADLDQFWRVRSWVDYDALPVERKRRVLPFIVQWVHGGADVPGSRVMRCYQSIMAIQSATVAATERYDAVLSPVAPGAGVPRGVADAVRRRGFRHGPHRLHGALQHVRPAGWHGQLGSPATASQSMPAEIAGRRFDDVGVLRLLHWYENSRPAQASPDWPVRASSGHDGRKVSGGQSVWRAHG